jgi:magnesium-transporting ATPase (P-type)
MFLKKQIFLGFTALKHHKRADTKVLIGKIEDAGIRPVLFSKEGVLETKSLAYELGMDNDWNSWISLSDNPSQLTKRINQDGNNVLPCGI